MVPRASVRAVAEELPAGDEHQPGRSVEAVQLVHALIGEPLGRMGFVGPHRPGTRPAASDRRGRVSPLQRVKVVEDALPLGGGMAVQDCTAWLARRHTILPDEHWLDDVRRNDQAPMAVDADSFDARVNVHLRS